MKFKTILVDPPWRYRNKNTGGSMKSGSAAKYATMSLEELKAFPIHDIRDRDCALFLWVPAPLLPEGLELMQSWKFKYKACIFWEKKFRLGLGFWWRNQVEMCLFGIKGKVPAYRSSLRNIIRSKPRRHSQKPEEFFDLIERDVVGPKIELFARDKREGWYCWGDEVISDIDMGGF